MFKKSEDCHPKLADVSENDNSYLECIEGDHFPVKFKVYKGLIMCCDFQKMRKLLAQYWLFGKY